MNQLKSPPSYGFNPLPPNWEDTKHLKAQRKPSTQIFGRTFSSAVWGGVSEDPSQTGFSVGVYPDMPPYTPLPPSGSPPKYIGIGLAPYSYWQRNQDSYLQIMQVVDERIGEILAHLASLPQAVRNNTVVVFTADHGEYAGAHGYVSGKVTSCYDEAFHVPLIVYDPSGRFADDVGTPRTALTSSVDVMPMLVSLGHDNRRSWIVGPYERMYGGRADLNALLASATAPGRSCVLLASDEAAPGYYNFNNAPTHVLGLRTLAGKLGTYSAWAGVTDNIKPSSVEHEYYDYATTDGQLELANRPNAPAAKQMLGDLFGSILKDELRAPLPGVLGAVQNLAKAEYLLFDAAARNMTQSSDVSAGQIATVFGYGLMF